MSRSQPRGVVVAQRPVEYHRHYALVQATVRAQACGDICEVVPIRCAAEDGVAIGVAVCFDEWSNGGDDGVSIFYNGEAIWENTR